ncbi:3-dehydroquinate synthase [Exiguobacterium flavidum]|uniref:3-dehydroquinate synthase n=1 Tax=Exiguobacterium flavidum TaxID=2184695 RepID=UPI000DF77058|nr:3-dehydroquinate synthase family protein [Exiguobacterium flavidum]
MTRIDVRASKPYPIWVEQDATMRLSEVHEIERADTLWVITDDTVDALHGAALRTSIDKQFPGRRIVLSKVPPGERSKRLDVYERLVSEGLSNQVTRQSVVLAFGGGMIGDLAGFVAATFMRGIPFVQLPTTLLAHDSSVGGKVGLNLPEGKNLIGAFHQPVAVLYSTGLLSTLPDREWRSGFFELLKHGFLYEPKFAEELIALNLEGVKSLDYEKWLVRGIEVKRRIVEQDERETSIRAFLNYGHTFGHAVEYASSGLTHGEAVGIGLVFAKMLERDDEGAGRIASLYKRLGGEIPELLPFDEYARLMGNDKKQKNGIRFVVDRGGFALVRVTDEELRRAFESTVRCLRWG